MAQVVEQPILRLFGLVREALAKATYALLNADTDLRIDLRFLRAKKFRAHVEVGAKGALAVNFADQDSLQ